MSHFFKIILPKSLRDGKLRIPTEFINKYGQGLSNLAFLKVTNGAQWEVELAECDGGVWLSKGWLDFAKYYSVQSGHFIVFRYEGNSVFHVLILEETGLEIEHYRSDGEEAKLDGEFEAPNMEETKGETSLPKKCTQAKETKLEKSKSKANANTTNREFQAKEDDIFISSTGPCPESEVLRRIEPLTSDEKFRALQNARSAMKTENPYFMVAMQASYVHSALFLHIPAYFVKKYLSSNKHVGDVILSMSDGRNWTVKYSCPKFTTKLHGKFYCGWNEFALDNNLKVGDVCAFELIEGTQMHFKVSIFRFTEEHCPLSGEGMSKKAKLNDSEKAKALGRTSAFTSKRPVFKVVMQPSYITFEANMLIPNDFAEKYMREKRCNVILEASGGRWLVKYVLRTCNGYKKPELCSGWRPFVRENNLKVGDVCVFEFIKGIEISFKVSIFRAAEDANRQQGKGAKNMSAAKPSTQPKGSSSKD